SRRRVAGPRRAVARPPRPRGPSGPTRRGQGDAPPYGIPRQQQTAPPGRRPRRPPRPRPGGYGARVRALVQRVSSASVTVAGERLSEIGPGLLVLLGVRRGDSEAEAD